jgi:hypothetical protein
MIGALFRTMGPLAPPPPPGAKPPLWGSEAHVRDLFGDRIEIRSERRDELEVTAFERPKDYVTHFKGQVRPTLSAQTNARRNGQEAELEEALDRFCVEWNLGTPDDARFDQEYLVTVATRR